MYHILLTTVNLGIDDSWPIMDSNTKELKAVSELGEMEVVLEAVVEVKGKSQQTFFITFFLKVSFIENNRKIHFLLICYLFIREQCNKC